MLDVRSPDNRLNARFQSARRENRAALVTFLTAYDPTPDLSLELLCGMADAGADVIELGVPFSDPMADGPAIQLANRRAFAQGITLKKTLDLVRRFRDRNTDTPIVLMGYFNPIYHHGVEAFLGAAADAGVDGLIVVDLPPEADDELCLPALERGIHFVHLTAPTTDDLRLPRVLAHASGFVYYVSIAGVTGTKDVDETQVGQAVARIKRYTDLPVAVGFGIKTPAQAARVAAVADGVVIGSAIINKIAENLDAEGTPGDGLCSRVLGFVSGLADGVRAGRPATQPKGRTEKDYP